MNITHFGKTVAGITLASLLLAACSGSTGTTVTTGAGTEQTGSVQEPTSSPQSYVAPSTSPVAQATTQATVVSDSTTSKPALSSKEDATSLNADLKNTTVSDESFN